jgi:chromosome segregation ATPase
MSLITNLQEELDQLKAENERLELENEDTLKKYEEAVEGFTKLSAEVLELRQQLAVPSDVLADCEALRLDAERYRWLRMFTIKGVSLNVAGALESLDRQIDDLSKGAQS